MCASDKFVCERGNIDPLKNGKQSQVPFFLKLENLNDSSSTGWIRLSMGCVHPCYIKLTLQMFFVKSGAFKRDNKFV